MTDHNAPRELWVVYHGSTEPELVIFGHPNDQGLLAMFKSLEKRESNAWLLHTMGQLPEWWRLVDQVDAINMAEHRRQRSRPGKDAELRWKNASTRERIALQRGWRIVQGQDGGGHQIYHLPKDPVPRITSVPIGDLEIVPLETPEVELQLVEKPALILPQQMGLIRV